jgi:putative FmdB family regulatory protein
MPLYEYECKSCKRRFEVRQSVTAEPIATCPTCGGPVRRVIHPVGIIFKGSGFYSTDNRPSSANSTPPGESGPEKAPAKEGEKAAATEAKTESTTSASAAAGEKSSSGGASPASSSGSTGATGG